MNQNDILTRLLAPGVVGEVLEARRIFIRGLVLDMVIGVHAHEQVRTQKVAIDVDLFLGGEGASDGLEIGDGFVGADRAKAPDRGLANELKTAELAIAQLCPKLCLGRDELRTQSTRSVCSPRLGTTHDGFTPMSSLTPRTCPSP